VVAGKNSAAFEGESGIRFLKGKLSKRIEQCPRHPQFLNPKNSSLHKNRQLSK